MIQQRALARIKLQNEMHPNNAARATGSSALSNVITGAVQGSSRSSIPYSTIFWDEFDDPLQGYEKYFANCELFLCFLAVFGDDDIAALVEELEQRTGETR